MESTFVFKSNNPSSFKEQFNSMINNKKHRKMVKINYKKIKNYTKESFAKNVR